MIPLALLPWRKIIPALAFLAAVGALIAWHVQRVDLARSQGQALGQLTIKAAWDAEIKESQRQVGRIEGQQRQLELERGARIVKEIERAQEATETARSDADRARADADRLRNAARAAAARCSSTSRDPGTASSGPPASPGADVLADVFERMERAGREMAAEADRRGIAGAACERLYLGLRHDALPRQPGTE